jgi:hypothetical protein
MNHWTELGWNIQARRAAVTRMGNPWVVTRIGGLFRLESGKWYQVGTPEKVTDVAINGNHISYTGVSGKVYKHGHGAILGPKAVRVAVDTHGNSVICGKDG